MSVEEPPAAAPTPRERILRAAAELLRAGGRDALTTRAVESAADVQAPTIYRLFGDKRGLVDAVARREMSDYVAAKAIEATRDEDRDPVDVLIDGWRSSVGFGLENPELFLLMVTGPPPAADLSSWETGAAILRDRVRRVAEAGRLAVGEQRAVDLIVASAQGVTLTLLSQPEQQRDLGLLDDMLAGLITTITVDGAIPDRVDMPTAANALRAMLATSAAPLTPGEGALLDELLARLAQPGHA